MAGKRYKLDDVTGGMARVRECLLAAHVEANPAITSPEGPRPLVLQPEIRVWCTAARKSGIVDQSRLQCFIALLDEWMAAAMGDSPAAEAEAFGKMMSTYGRMEQDALLEFAGADTLTGLRSSSVMRYEIEREMERQSRHDIPFTVAIGRLDYHDQILERGGMQALEIALQRGADVVIECMRPSDDAYRYGNKELVVSLKHSDATGAIAFVRRINEYLDQHRVCIETPAGEIPLSLSFCVGEPMPGEDLDTLFANIRDDLRRCEEGPGSAIQYEDISPLQRYVNTMLADEAQATTQA